MAGRAGRALDRCAGWPYPARRANAHRRKIHESLSRDVTAAASTERPRCQDDRDEFGSIQRAVARHSGDREASRAGYAVRHITQTPDLEWHAVNVRIIK